MEEEVKQERDKALRYVQELEELHRKLEAIHHSALNYHKADTPKIIAKEILDTLDKVLSFENATFIVVEGNVRRVIATIDNEMPFPRDLPLDGKGVTVRAIRTGETQNVPDTRLDEDYIGLPNREDYLSELAVPVKVDGEVISVINVESMELGAFTESDRRLMETLAAHAGSAISRLRQIDSYRTHAAVFNSVSDSLMLINADDSSIVSANRPAQKQAGLTLAEIVGRPCYEVAYQRTSPCEPTDHTCPIKKILETGESSRVIHLRQDIDGNPQFKEISASPIRNWEGEIIQFVHVTRDITERIMMEEELKESEQRFRSLIDNTREAIVVTDFKGNIASVNPFGVSMLGYEDMEEILGKPAVNFYVESSQRGELYTELMEKGFSTGKELRLKHKDGSEIWVSVFSTLQRDDDGKIMRTESFFRDITDRKLAEIKLRELVYRFNSVSPGQSYLVESHETCMKIYADLVFHGVPGLCFTRDDPETLIAEYALDRDSIVVMASKQLGDFRLAANLQAVSLEISKFIKENESVVVVLDGLNYLLSRSSFDLIFNFIQDKRFDFINEKGVLLIPLDLATLSQQQIAILKSELMIHSDA